MQNSLPSGSAITTQVWLVPWPTSTRVAPSPSRRATSVNWCSGRRSRCRRFLLVLGSGTLMNNRSATTVFATTFGWLDNPLRIFVLADYPIQCFCPEPGQSSGILGIDDQGTDTQSHGITVGNAAAVVDRFGWADHLRMRV